MRLQSVASVLTESCIASTPDDGDVERQQLMCTQLAYDVMMDEDQAVVLPCRHTEEGVQRLATQDQLCTHCGIKGLPGPKH